MGCFRGEISSIAALSAATALTATVAHADNRPWIAFEGGISDSSSTSGGITGGADFDGMEYALEANIPSSSGYIDYFRFGVRGGNADGSKYGPDALDGDRQILDFAVGREVGLGKMGKGDLSFGVRSYRGSAGASKYSDVGIPPFITDPATLGIRGEFKGMGPRVAFDGSFPIADKLSLDYGLGASYIQGDGGLLISLTSPAAIPVDGGNINVRIEGNASAKMFEAMAGVSYKVSDNAKISAGLRYDKMSISGLGGTEDNWKNTRAFLRYTNYFGAGVDVGASDVNASFGDGSNGWFSIEHAQGNADLFIPTVGAVALPDGVGSSMEDLALNVGFNTPSLPFIDYVRFGSRKTSEQTGKYGGELRGHMLDFAVGRSVGIGDIGTLNYELGLRRYEGEVSQHDFSDPTFGGFFEGTGPRLALDASFPINQMVSLELGAAVSHLKGDNGLFLDLNPVSIPIVGQLFVDGTAKQLELEAGIGLQVSEATKVIFGYRRHELDIDPGVLIANFEQQWSQDAVFVRFKSKF